MRFLLALAPPDGVHPDFTLSAGGDIEEAAANLFAVMHQADQMAVKSIAFAPIPMSGLGLAINDRLALACRRTLSYRQKNSREKKFFKRANTLTGKICVLCVKMKADF